MREGEGAREGEREREDERERENERERESKSMNTPNVNVCIWGGYD